MLEAVGGWLRGAFMVWQCKSSRKQQAPPSGTLRMHMLQGSTVASQLLAVGAAFLSMVGSASRALACMAHALGSVCWWVTSATLHEQA